MSSPNTENVLPQKLLPQLSIKFLLLLIVVIALLLWLVRSAMADSSAYWSRCFLVMIATAVSCFAFYGITYLVVWLVTIPFAATASKNLPRGTKAPSSHPQPTNPSIH